LQFTVPSNPMSDLATARPLFVKIGVLFLIIFLAIGAVAYFTRGQSNKPARSAFDRTTIAGVPGNRLKIEVVADQLRAPWSIAFLEDGRVLFTERPGRVRLINADGSVEAKPVLEVPDMLADTKLGLMGLVLDPDFATSPYVYLAYGYRDNDDKRVRVARYRWTGDELVEPDTLLEGIPAQFNHSGGRLRFGPDKTLFITTGDADHPPNAQDLKSLGGKILRINRDGSIPDDNPFVGREDARPEIYSYGHRNSQGIDFEPGTGRPLSSEHGPNGGDELNWTAAGKNYGWPTITHDASADGLESPLVQFTPSIAPASGTFYNGEMFPDLAGDYLAGCLRGECVLRVQLDSAGGVKKVERWLFTRFGRIRDVQVAPDGAIWLTTSMFDPPEANGAEGFDQIVRITPAGPDDVANDRTTVVVDQPVDLPPKMDLGTTPAERYAALCASCHGANLEGGLHGGLVTKQWTYARSEEELFRLLANGIPDRGMPGARPLIHDDGCRQLAAWVWEQHVRSEPRQAEGKP
jgi:glucose/arabinose dehydrogenase